MAASSLSSFINFAVPATIIIVVLCFVLFKWHLWDAMKKAGTWIGGKSSEVKVSRADRIITYE